MAEFDKQDSSTASTKAPSRYCSTNRVTRNRYCLRSPNGYARKRLYENPAEAIQWSITKQPACHELRPPRPLPHPVTFQFDETLAPVAREGESYAEYMDRLYALTLTPIRDPKMAFVPSSDGRTT